MSASDKKKLRKELNASKLTEKQMKEQQEAKRLKNYTTIFVAAIAVVVVLAIGIVAGTGYRNSGIIERNTDALTVGDHTLTSAELNYFFIDTVNETYNSWYSQYGDYANLYVQWLEGFDMSKPLEEQKYDEEKTYADYFAELAIEDAKSAHTMCDLAAAAGHTLTEEDKEAVAATYDSMELYASLSGYNNINQYLKAVYGNGAKSESFKAYLELITLAQSYQKVIHDSFTYEDADIEAYDKENANQFNSYTYSTFYLSADEYVTCTADDEDTEHEHTDEELAAGLKAAEKAAGALVATGAKTAEELDEQIAALEKYKDDSSAVSSLSENLLGSKITDKNILEWLSDASRKEGDLDVLPYEVTTTDEEGNETTEIQGYFVILFTECKENTENLVNVRHILINYKGGKTDEATGETTYTDEEKKAAEDKAQEILDSWKAGDATEESFAALVHDNTNDTGSKENGGLYEDVYPGQMVEAFNDWCFDSSRKAGDTGIVHTEYGAHLIYFVDTQETTYREYMIENTLRDTDYENWYNEAVDAVTATALDLSKLSRDLVMAG